jgi:hypothetical protein
MLDGENKKKSLPTLLESRRGQTLKKEGGGNMARLRQKEDRECLSEHGEV